MQGLRQLVHQDENSGLFGGLASKLQGGGSDRLSKDAGSASTRKALGNITNRALQPGADGRLPGKTPATKSGRPALGDLTNASAAKAGGTQAAKPREEAQHTAASCSLDSRASQYASDGVERRAGKGWEQLERERAEREEDEIDARLASLASAPLSHLPSFFPWVSAASCPRYRAARRPCPRRQQLHPPPATVRLWSCRTCSWGARR
jgi:hypothetical protein